MKRYEKESFLKSFLLFFILLFSLLFFIAYGDYRRSLHFLKDNLKDKMELCSYSLDCKEFEIDFIPIQKNKNLGKLYEDESEIYSLFSIPTVKDFYLKLFIKKTQYEKLVLDIRYKLFKHYIIYLFLIILLSYLFSLYALSPIKKALKLNEEFIKDILHDFNTPISSIVINLKILQKNSQNSKVVNRIQNSMETILSLQENLKLFLNSNKLQKEEINLKDILIQRIDNFKSSYKDIDFELQLEDKMILSNPKALSRILDNLISNALKYNKKGGFVKVKLQNTTLTIEDSGKGIKNPQKVFDRYYKESDRGLGIGLHIVKKLCDEENILIDIKSLVNIGTIVRLDFKRVMIE